MAFNSLFYRLINVFRKAGPVGAKMRKFLANASRGQAAVRLGIAVGIIVMATACVTPVGAQGWWPFGGDDEPDRPSVPSEPVYRPDGQPQQQPGGQPPATNWATQNPICLQLERRLVQESRKGDQWQSELPKIEEEIGRYDREYNVGSNELDRRCYEFYLFTKSFRSTPACRKLRREVEDAKRKLSELEARRQTLISSQGRSHKDDIIRELARNNCGANYVEMARRSSGGMWFDNDSEQPSGNVWNPQNSIGVTTYRTLCVRLCDGYYFPVSFSTLPSHFPQDATACNNKCAAPAELYYYPNPGGTVDQSVALSTKDPYTKQKFAFRYRKEYINGCSCKESEYKPAQSGVTKQSSWSAGSTVQPTEQASPDAKAPADQNSDWITQQ